MALNPDYVPMTPLWELHSDKDSGEFLRSGYALFFRDTARTIGKVTFQLTGSPPNYSYMPYGYLQDDGSWRIDLNDQGAFDSIVYGYPLDEDGNTDLYFIQFYNKDGVFQFSREGWPNFSAQAVAPTQEIDINYIPNGQFLLHLDLPVSSNYEAGQVRSPITRCAFGGWTFERPSGSTARDFVTFKRFSAYTAIPQKSPRYEIEIECESPSPGDIYKDLRIKFADVNKFADAVNEYTFAISGKIALGGGINVDLVLIKNFGTGGDSATEVTLTTFAITSTYQVFYHAFNFGVNTGKSIGIQNDDFIQLALRFPVDSIYDVVFSDAILTPGNVTSPSFNDETNRQFIYRSIFSNVTPASDGSDLYLPLTLSPDGLVSDTSVIGTILAKATYDIGIGELDCIGEKLEGDGYSPDGIPYARLQKKIMLSNVLGAALPLDVPLFGTGLDFVTADILSSLDLKISTNVEGSTAAPSDGSSPTGFVFRNNHTGQVETFARGYLTQTNKFYIISDAIGVSTEPDAGTVSITFDFITNGEKARPILLAQIGALSAGTYFRFENPDGGIRTVWFTVNGAGSAPAVSGLPIQVNLFTGINATDEAKIVSDSISGKQVSQITLSAAASIPAASYWTFETLTQSYYVWYQKDGVGTDPAPSGKVGIKVKISNSDTKNQVTSKTAIAINRKYYATPDLRGLFLRATNGEENPAVDLDAALRYAQNSVTYGNVVGSLQVSSNISHDHSILSSKNIYAAISGKATGGDPVLTDSLEESTEITFSSSYNGLSESRPQNIYVNYFIKY